MADRFQWTTPRYAQGDWVVFIRRNRETIEGQVQDVTTHYPNGRAQHSYRVKPYGLKNCVTVAEGLILRRGERSAYGAVRYHPTRTPSDGRTGAHGARP